MIILSGDAEERAKQYFQRAVEVARSATCQRARCGAVIVSAGEVIGEGFNSPPGERENMRHCHYDKVAYHPKVTDKTCCVHAEQRAVTDALRRNPDRLSGADLYFARVDSDGAIERSGRPYCTLCSKIVLDMGVAYFYLWHAEGIARYKTDEYNAVSFAYAEPH
jgi:deoxycytidylate deaminase